MGSSNNSSGFLSGFSSGCTGWGGVSGCCLLAGRGFSAGIFIFFKRTSQVSFSIPRVVSSVSLSGGSISDLNSSTFFLKLGDCAFAIRANDVAIVGTSPARFDTPCKES